MWLWKAQMFDAGCDLTWESPHSGLSNPSVVDKYLYMTKTENIKNNRYRQQHT